MLVEEAEMVVGVVYMRYIVVVIEWMVEPLEVHMTAQKVGTVVEADYRRYIVVGLGLRMGLLEVHRMVEKAEMIVAEVEMVVGVVYRRCIAVRAEQWSEQLCMGRFQHMQYMGEGFVVE